MSPRRAAVRSSDEATETPANRVWLGNPRLAPFLVPIADLMLDPTNARGHDSDPRNLEVIRASLARFGQQRMPLTASGVVRCGNATIQAARALGWTHLAAIESDLVAETA